MDIIISGKEIGGDDNAPHINIAPLIISSSTPNSLVGSGNHFAVVTADGCVYMSGHNDNGQLGSTETCTTPWYRVDHTQNKCDTHVSAENEGNSKEEKPIGSQLMKSFSPMIMDNK